MENKLYKIGFLVLALGLLSACSGVNTKGFNPNPYAKDLLSGEFYPDPAYDYNYKNKNNLIVVDLNLEAVDKALTPLPSNINSASIKAALVNEFEKSKRFTVLDDGKRKDASMVLKVLANVTYSEIDSKSRKSIGYELRMSFVGTNADGMQEFGLNVKGGAADYFDKNFLGEYVISANTQTRLLMSCVDKCFRQVFPELARRMPVSGKIESARYTGEDFILSLNRGANDGVVQSMPFVIGYADEAGNQIFIARGRAISVSSNSSQIIIEEFNPKEKLAVAYAKEQLMRGDVSFIKSAFAVSKYRAYEEK